jgi:hypothetical protein
MKTYPLLKHHVIKMHWVNGDVASCIINLGTGWRLVVSFTPRPFYPRGKSPRYPLDRRLGGPQNRSGRGGEKKKIPATAGIRTAVVQPVAYSLYCLSYPGSSRNIVFLYSYLSFYFPGVHVAAGV